MGKIITLTSDWGNQDYYVASVKGLLYSSIENVIVVDITHEIPPFHFFTAAFVLKNCFRNFPKGTIHIIAVNSEATKESPHVLVEYEEHIFICADNGIFSILLDHDPTKIIELDILQDTDCHSFPGKDVFTKAAIMLCNGAKYEELGFESNKLNRDLKFLQPGDRSVMIPGIVIHIDRYGNIITNITKEEFKKFTQKRKFRILFGTYELNEVHTSYQDVPQGELVCFFNSSNLLEIAQNMGNAAEVLGLRFNDSVKVVLQ